MSAIVKAGSASKVPFQLPALPDNQCGYYLLPVGRLGQGSTNELEFQVSLLPVRIHTTGLQTIGETIKRVVSVSYAGALRAGTLWSESGQVIDNYHQQLFASQVIRLTNKSFPVSRLGEIIPAQYLATLPYPPSPDIWVNVVVCDGRTLLIPCFEMLRAFYFEEGAKILPFLFSQLPLEALARIASKPTRSNHKQARICIATRSISNSAARVLAELLLNSSYYTTIQHAITERLITSRITGRPSYFKSNFALGRTTELRAFGHELLVESSSYLWVSSIIPTVNYYSFKKLFYYLLTSCDKELAMPIISPLISKTSEGCQSVISTVKIKECSDILLNYSSRNLKEFYLPYPSSYSNFFPRTVCAGAWARIRDYDQTFVYANQVTTDPCLLTQPRQHDNLTVKRLRQLAVVLKKMNFHVTYPQLNNADGRFGVRMSVWFEEDRFPLMGPEFYDYVYRAGLLNIKNEKYNIYFAQALTADYPVLAWHAIGEPLHIGELYTLMDAVYQADTASFLANREIGYKRDKIFFTCCKKFVTIENIVSCCQHLMNIFPTRESSNMSFFYNI